MPPSRVGAQDESSDGALALLAPLDTVDLDRFAVVGQYVRFEEHTRNPLREFRQRVTRTFHARSPAPNNFLVWGPPGSGKSFLIQQIAQSLGSGIRYAELNLAQLDEDGLRSELDRFEADSRPGLCFVDEVDAHQDRGWPYEVLLPYLEPPVPRGPPRCYCLAGSGGSDLAELKRRMGARPKGPDLLSRVPNGNEVVVLPLGLGDKILVAIAQLLVSAREEGRPIREVEKFALYYIATSPALSSARQLRSLASQCAQRIPPGDDRVRYDYLFPAGEVENKRFWSRSKAARERLENSFVHLAGDPLGVGERSSAVGSHDAPRGSGLAPLALSRIAVLPIANISPDPGDEFFADGLTEELISAVSRVKELGVISRTSVIQYKDRTAFVKDIGRELGVGSVLEGSVRKAGTHVRISTQLIDVANDRPLWSETYDRDLRDIFAVQSEIALRVAEALQTRLVVGTVLPQKKGTSDPSAYTAYLKGRYFWNRATKEWLDKAVEQFERSISLDPLYASAYAGLADAHLLLGRRGDVPPNDAYPKAIENAQKALSLDGTLAEPHAALGSIRQEHEWRWAEAEVEFRRAIELNPSYSTAHSWYGLFLGHVGRFDEAIKEAGRAQDLDPLSPRIHASAAEEYLFARRYDDAIEAARRSIEIDPAFGSGHAYVGEALVGKGLYDEAVAEFERADKLFGAQTCLGRLGHAHALAGRTDEATRILERLKAGAVPPSSANPFLRPSPYNSLEVGLVLLGLGALGPALDWFEKSRDERVPEVVHFKCEPIYDPVRAEPRFLELVRSIDPGE